jgi:hypothetical protein
LWLPWISANHLHGINALEEYDPALFQQLTAMPQKAREKLDDSSAIAPIL